MVRELNRWGWIGLILAFVVLLPAMMAAGVYAVPTLPDEQVEDTVELAVGGVDNNEPLRWADDDQAGHGQAVVPVTDHHGVPVHQGDPHGEDYGSDHGHQGAGLGNKAWFLGHESPSYWEGRKATREPCCDDLATLHR